MKRQLKEKLAPFTDVPIIFISVKEKMRIMKAMEVALEVYENKTRKVSTSNLNDIMLKAVEVLSCPGCTGQCGENKICNPIANACAIVCIFHQLSRRHKKSL